jgi:DnaD/phage-associated family protein
MGIIAYCVSIDKGKLRYIEKTAQGMHNDGVVTYKDLESYLANKKKYAEFESMVKRVIGAENRSLTASEVKHVQLWEKEYKANQELVKLAYDKTISAINKPSMPYMSKILESWFKNGLDNVKKVLESEQANKSANKKSSGNDDGSFDFSLEDIFERP